MVTVHGSGKFALNILKAVTKQDIEKQLNFNDFLIKLAKKMFLYFRFFSMIFFKEPCSQKYSSKFSIMGVIFKIRKKV